LQLHQSYELTDEFKKVSPFITVLYPSSILELMRWIVLISKYLNIFWKPNKN